MLSAPPHFPRPPNRLIIQGAIPPSLSICPERGSSLQVCAEMINNYTDMRHLTDSLSSSDQPNAHLEHMPRESMRDSLEKRFLTLEIRKPKEEMVDLDYLLEACRIGALIFLQRAFRDGWPRCLDIRELRRQLKELLLEKESHITQHVHPQEQWGYYTWSLFIGGVHSQEDEEIAFFAKRIAVSTRVWQAKGFGSWADILHLIKRVGRRDALQSPSCETLGKQVERFIRSNGARDPAPETSAHTYWPAEFNTLLTAWSSAAKFDVVCCSSSHEHRPHLIPLLMSREPLSGEPDLES